VNYNYFVINKNTKNFDVAQAFLLNLTNESTQKSYIKAFPYYFPSQITLESDVLDEKISPDYNISLKDFFRDDMTYSSFNK
jgi:spermidine/putrescine-binding protein